ncbi:MAG TPA: hypothetical protein VL738_15120 [Dactylosporangium sp.]|jgi:hypothetical protein|nr:hypothetical protein [Dactylosporangium sp.]
MRLRIVALTVIAGLGLGALGGCGSKENADQVQGPAPSIVPASPSARAPGGPSSLPPQPAGSTIAIRGTVRDGVEPGCVLLATDAKTYLLIGGDKSALNSGAQVTVYGVEQPGLMTTCQQGTPFKVSRIEP